MNDELKLPSLAFADDIVSIFFPINFNKIDNYIDETEQEFLKKKLNINWEKTFM